MCRAFFSVSVTLVLAAAIFFALPVMASEKKPSPDMDFESVEARRIILSLQQERSRLKKEKQQLEKKRKDLKILKAEVEEKINELKKLRSEVRSLLAQKKQKKSQKVKELSKIYAQMDPQKAAVALDSLKQDLVIDILSTMRSRTAGEILNFMNKDKAAELSEAFPKLKRQ